MAREHSLKGRRVMLPSGIGPASLYIRGGLIERVGDYSEHADQDFNNLVILPGLVDTHVHINEPGRTEWEGFETATKAAAAGGITTLIEMPLNSIPATTSPEAYDRKIAAATGQCWVDVGFWGGVIPGNTHHLEGLLDAGCFGFKCFLSPSGVNEFPNVAEDDLRQALPILAKRQATLQAHAELPSYLEEPTGDPRAYANYLASRPPEAEQAAIETLIGLSREYNLPIHIVHLACKEALRSIQNAKVAGVAITVETCPHYLTFAAEDIADGRTEFKCAPPIRDGSHREALWNALKDGTIDAIVSDHSPCLPALKWVAEGNFFNAWGGIASLEIGLSTVWTEARKRGIPLERVSQWMSTAPARLAQLHHRKGAIQPGFDADLVIFDPEAEWTVQPAALLQRHKTTPYAYRALRGKVLNTYLRGELVQIDGPATGQVLRP